MEYLMNFLLSLPNWASYVLVFVILLACGLGVPIPEDITLFAGGAAAYYEKANVYWMIVVAMLGVMIGDSFIFFLGRKYGPKIVGKGIFKRVLTQERFEYVKEKVKTGGNKFIFAARFMPGLRAPVYFSSGSLGVSYLRFFLLDGSAALISVPAIVYSVYYFGDQLDRVIQVIKRIEHGIIFVILAAVLFYAIKWFIKKKRDERAEMA